MLDRKNPTPVEVKAYIEHVRAALDIETEDYSADMRNLLAVLQQTIVLEPDELDYINEGIKEGTKQARAHLYYQTYCSTIQVKRSVER